MLSGTIPESCALFPKVTLHLSSSGGCSSSPLEMVSLLSFERTDVDPCLLRDQGPAIQQTFHQSINQPSTLETKIHKLPIWELSNFLDTENGSSARIIVLGKIIFRLLLSFAFHSSI